jgi:anti-sigma-K factor RskA
MTDVVDHKSAPDDDTLAAEYVLGVLSPNEHAATSQRLLRDSAFAHLVEVWEMRLIPWIDEVAPESPPATVWTRINAALPMDAQARPSIWQSLALWRSLTAAAVTVAVACLAFLIFASRGAPEPLVASIDGGGQHHFVATIDASRGTIAVVPAAFSSVPSRVPELWLIPSDGKPRSLGLLSADHSVVLKIPGDLRAFAHDNSVLAVSLEPPGGSPSGAPTGPVVAQGRLTNL